MNNAAAGVLALGLVLGTLAIMASRTLAPVKVRPKGRVELTVALPLLQRAMAQKMNIISICAVVAVGGGLLSGQRVISPLIGYLALLVMVGLLFKRQQLVLTTQGILVHNASFRGWKDFDDVRVRGNKVVLHSSTRLASMSLYVPAGSRAEVTSVIRRHVGSPAAPAPRVSANRRHRRAV